LQKSAPTESSSNSSGLLGNIHTILYIYKQLLLIFNKKKHLNRSLDERGLIQGIVVYALLFFTLVMKSQPEHSVNYLVRDIMPALDNTYENRNLFTYQKLFTC
jgi:hypothetical protein